MFTFVNKRKKIKGRSLWLLPNRVLHSVKKAVTIVPKLSKICVTNKSGAVVQYASGRNKAQVFQAIDNGTYAMILSNGKPEGDFDELVDNSQSFANDLVLEMGLLGELPDNWEPLDGITAPGRYCNYGKLTFVCFGPTSKYFSATLSMGWDTGQAIEKKREGSRLRTAQRKLNKSRDDVNHDVGGSERGMSLEMKVSFGFMVQHKDEAEQKHHDREFMTLSTCIKELRMLAMLKMRRAEGIVDDDEKEMCYWSPPIQCVCPWRNSMVNLVNWATKNANLIQLWAGCWSTQLYQWG